MIRRTWLKSIIASLFGFPQINQPNLPVVRFKDGLIEESFYKEMMNKCEPEFFIERQERKTLVWIDQKDALYANWKMYYGECEMQMCTYYKAIEYLDSTEKYYNFYRIDSTDKSIIVYGPRTYGYFK